MNGQEAFSFLTTLQITGPFSTSSFLPGLSACQIKVPPPSLVKWVSTGTCFWPPVTPKGFFRRGVEGPLSLYRALVVLFFPFTHVAPPKRRVLKRRRRQSEHWWEPLDLWSRGGPYYYLLPPCPGIGRKYEVQAWFSVSWHAPSGWAQHEVTVAVSLDSFGRGTGSRAHGVLLLAECQFCLG